MTTRALVRLCAIGAAAALVAGMILTGPVRPQARPSENVVEKLHALFDAEWERAMREDPTLASILGNRRYNDRWPDRSLAAIERSHADDVRVLDELAALDRSQLLAPERLNYDLFRQQYRDRVESYGFRGFLLAIDHREGVQIADQLRENLRFETEKDYQDWVARLRAVGGYVDQTIALLEKGIAEGRTQPRVIMERVPDQIAAQVVDDPAASPFYIPFRKISAEVAPETQERLRADARSAITAYRRLQTFFVERYLGAARTTVGAWDLPDGDAYYAFRARTETTTAMTPDEIHQLGLEEVARIRAEMEAIVDRAGFRGSFAEFLDHLRTDQRSTTGMARSCSTPTGPFPNGSTPSWSGCSAGFPASPTE